MQDNDIQEPEEQGISDEAFEVLLRQAAAQKKREELIKHNINKNYNINGVIIGEDGKFAGYRMRYRWPNTNKYNADGTLKEKLPGYWSEEYKRFFMISDNGVNAFDEKALMKLPKFKVARKRFILVEESQEAA